MSTLTSEENGKESLNGELHLKNAKEKGESESCEKGDGQRDQEGYIEEEEKEGSEYELRIVEDEENEMDDFEEELIRIRSQGDASIFEQYDEDLEDKYVPEVNKENTSSSRKRKQELSVRNNNDCNYSVEEVEEVIVKKEPTYTLNPDMFEVKIRRRDRIPLYLCNPDDYENDPAKQAQIRRAKITYLHHKRIKDQIVKLTEENRKLREQNQDLKAAVVWMSECGCEISKKINVDELLLNIPKVPPRMYTRGNKSLIAVPFSNYSLSPDSLVAPMPEQVKAKRDTRSSQSSPLSPSGRPAVPPTPLINIGMGISRFIQLNPPGSMQDKSSERTAPLANGRHPIVPGSPAKRFLSNGPSYGVTPKPSMAATVKKEGGGIVNSTLSSVSSHPAKKDAISTAPTASQLLFGTRIVLSNLTESTHTAQQSVSYPSTLQSNPSKVFLSNQNGLFTSPSGRPLKLLQVPPVNPKSSSVHKPTYILSKPFQPREDACHYGTVRKPFKKKDLEELWKRFDNDDEDDEGKIATINGTTVAPRNRKQSMESRKLTSTPKYKEEIDVTTYEDIIFEEAV